MAYNRYFEQEQPNIKKFYAKHFEKFGSGAAAAAWHDQFSQEIRFSALTLAGDLDNKKILDVGCGLGDFYGYLQQQKIPVTYTGIDFTEPLIDSAKKKYPDGTFICDDFFSHNFDRTFDYVMASGTFNVLVLEPETYIKQAISRMFNLANHAVALNLLSSYAPEDKKNLTHFNYRDPAALLTLALSLTPYVSLQHHYLPHDFTLILYKQ